MADNANTLPGEVWKPVVGFEGAYEVSSHGRVRSVPRWVNSKNNSTALKRGLILSPHFAKRTGYFTVALHQSGRSKTVCVHRLVCEAFHGPAPEGLGQVAHCDGTRTNNVAENLRWDSAKGNAADRLKHGTQQLGERQHLSKLTEDKVREIRAAYTGAHGDLVNIGRTFGVSAAQVLNIVKRRHWKHI